MPSIVALTRIRNEAWILRYSLSALLSWVDHVVVALHACVDDSEQIVQDMAQKTGRITILVDTDPSWNEMRQFNSMLSEARRLGAKAIVVSDADEILTAPFMPAARRLVEQLKPYEALRVPLHNLWRSLDIYRDDKGKHGKQFAVLAFCDASELHWPVSEQFNHRAPVGVTMTKQIGTMWRLHGVMHLQRANWRRAQARQDLYRMREVLMRPGRESVHAIDARYASSLDERGITMKPVPAEWWQHGIGRGLIDLEAEPWEIGECKRLLAEHGRRKFMGLSLSCL